MSVYYDEITKTWYSKVRYKNWQGGAQADYEKRFYYEKRSKAMGSRVCEITEFRL